MLERESLKRCQQISNEERVIVGVNRYTQKEETKFAPFAIDTEKKRQTAMERIQRWRGNRDNEKVKEALDNVRDVMIKYDSLEEAGNLMPALIDAARVNCTVAEMTEAVLSVSGGRVIPM
jgi:methylmalonyl-CoA mutase N-terminal domain/subunit